MQYFRIFFIQIKIERNIYRILLMDYAKKCEKQRQDSLSICREMYIDFLKGFENFVFIFHAIYSRYF